MNQYKARNRRVVKLIAGAMASLLLVSSVSATAMMADTPLSTVANAATIFAKGAEVKTTDSLNLRKSASSSAKVLSVLPKGTKLTVAAKNTGTWVKVTTSSGQTGYVSGNYLKVSETLVNYVTTGSDLRYRSTPSTSGAVKGTLKKGVTVQVVSGYSKTANNIKWYKIKINNNYYYTAASYLKKGSTVAVKKVSLNKTTANVKVGSAVTLKATVTPSNATDTTVTWSSSDKTIATVTSAGAVKGVKAGTATITATSANGKKASCKITVKKAANVAVTGVTLSKTTASMTMGETLTLKATVTPDNATDSAVTWSSSDKTIATVSTSGKVKGVAAGTATITVTTANEKTAQCELTVKEADETETLVKYTVLDNLNYRTEPNLESDTVQGVLSKNTVVEVVEGSSTKADNVTWYKIKKDGSYYYVSASYLKKGTTTTEPEEPDEDDDTTDYTITESVNYRSQPKVSSSTKKGTLPAGSVVAVVNGSKTTSDGYSWYKIKIGSKYYYVVADYLKKGVVALEASVAATKTLYLATISGGTWKSSDPAVASVTEGFVYGAKKGTATITCTTSSGKKTWDVTVKAAPAVKLGYVGPNVASTGEKVTFVAITDTSRNAVKFVVNGKSKVVTDYETETAAERNGFPATKSRVWKYTTTFSAAGTYSAKIYSATKADGSNMSSSYYTADAFVVSTQSESESSVENRRMSDKGLEVIASWEGYYPAVYLDPLTATIVPTVGYGYTFSQGDSFYNNLTKTEAWALLCEAINTKSYTTQVNEFITKNNIRANQRQFDSMVSFSYNCGSGWWNGSAQFDLRVLLLNAVNPNSVQTKIDNDEKVKGTTSLKTPVYSSKKQTGSPSKYLEAGAAVTIKAATWDSSKKAAWYKVTSGSISGYVPAPYVHITSHSFGKNMNYMDAITFGSELLAWHHAGGNCYAGLVYRRLGEAKLFSFGNYSGAKNNSDEKGVNNVGYLLPSCIANKNWLK